MGKKYIFIVNFQDCAGNEFELYSDEKLASGIFDSYEAAKNVADALTLYKIIYTYHHYINDDYDGEEAWEEEIDSLNGVGGTEGCLDDEPGVFFSYESARSVALCHVGNDDEHEYKDQDGVVHGTHGMYSIVKMEDFTIEIEEITE